jgi:microcystin degradation protein MlrC
MRALSSRLFCPCDSRRVSLWDLSAGFRYTTAQHIIVVKSLVHYRAAFMPIASRVIEVDTPGLSNPDVLRLDFKYVRRPMYPLDVDMQWTPAAL